MLVYPNCFGSAIPPTSYLGEKFQAAKEWFTSSPLLPLAGSEADFELQRALDCGDFDEGKKKKYGERAKRAAQVYADGADQGAPVMLHLVWIMYKKLTDLIQDSSGEGDSVPADIVDRLRLLRGTMDMLANDGALAVCQAVPLA